jgi:hypothetical protein
MIFELVCTVGRSGASRQSVRVAVRIPMITRVAILGVNLLPSLSRNLFSAPPVPLPRGSIQFFKLVAQRSVRKEETRLEILAFCIAKESIRKTRNNYYRMLYMIS